MHRLKQLNRVGLTCKKSNAQAYTLSKELAVWLEQRGIDVWQSASSDELIPPLDLMIILGGDGTIISTARKLIGSSVPIVGINFGKVGFLAELTTQNWKETFKKGIANGIAIEKRLVLHFSLFREGACIKQGVTINDVAFTRGKVARLVRLKLTIDDMYFTCLRSDGLIFSTPTGSTGYASSAGGSLIHPTLSCYIATAICPFLSVFPPIILTPKTVCKVSINESDPDLYLTLDGQETVKLEAGDDIIVTGKEGGLSIAQFGTSSYYTRLQQAGFVNSNLSC